MIRNFSDHAANERTFLAWVRTAVTVLAFGFVVERFDLFLRVARSTAHLPGARPASSGFGQAAGLGLMGMGLAIVAVAAVRFLRTSRAIDEPVEHPGPGSRLDIALAALLVLLGLALAGYLALNVSGRG